MRSLALALVASLSLTAVACKDDGKKSSVEAYDDYMKKSKASEAELNLRALEKALRAHHAEMSLFPSGTAAATPATPCCEGPNHKCAVATAEWTGNPVWSALDFEMVEPAYFQYSYESADGKTAVVRAVGDLDCDGTAITHELKCEIVEGNAQCTHTAPANAD